MTDPGRPTPACRARSPRRTTPGRLTRAVQYTGRLLCWSLATAMATAAADLLLDPRAPWWTYTWPTPWFLTGAAALAWAALRACEKNADDPPADDEDPRRDEWEHAA
ncbi:MULTISPECIES: hypothetical protein [unclassified Streptomyces]|uniref:hypothetical protein n=1 Tax=unclassified Streptomyces TaxID=2593676 RepID=UPI0036EDC9FE